MPAENAAEQPRTLSDFARKRFKRILDRMASTLLKVGLTPNTLTLAGLVGHAAGAILIAQGRFLSGGIVIFFLAPVDALDGAMAKLRGEPTPFGAFLDSVTDRYSEIALYSGLAYYYLQSDENWLVGLTLAALAGSIMVSYTRARAEGLGYEVRVGLFTRLERYLALVPTLLLGVPWLGVIAVAILANVTAFQRIGHVWKKSQGSTRKRE